MADSILEDVIALALHQSGLKRVSPDLALDQDLRISGDDVIGFVAALADRHGDDVWHWPWQRFAELSEPHLFTGLWLVSRFLSWPFRGRLFDPSPFERLEVRHIVKAIEVGHWVEP